MMAANAELLAHLNQIIEEGAGLDEIMAALDAAPATEDVSATEDMSATADDMGRPTVDLDTHARG